MKQRPTERLVRCRCCTKWFVAKHQQTLCEPCWTSDGTPEVTQPVSEIGERVQQLQRINDKMKKDIKEMRKLL